MNMRYEKYWGGAADGGFWNWTAQRPGQEKCIGMGWYRWTAWLKAWRATRNAPYMEEW